MGQKARQRSVLHFCDGFSLNFFCVVTIFLSLSVVWPRVSAVSDHFFDCLESFEQSSSAVEQQKLMNPRAIGAAADWITTIVQGSMHTCEADEMGIFYVAAANSSC